MRRLLLLIATAVISWNLSAQTDTMKYVLTLDEVIEMAITNSSAVKNVQNQNVRAYWQYRNYKTRFRPQLVLSGDLPNYTHTTQPITQPDGSIEFKQVSNLAASGRLSLNQSIPQLGTYIWAGTTAYGIRNLNKGENGFSGSPFSIGFSQPLFAYNWMKWFRMTEPMIYDESQKLFIEQIENIAVNATHRFFRYLTVQTSYNLAASNLKNSMDNLRISETKKHWDRFPKMIFHASNSRY